MIKIVTSAGQKFEGINRTNASTPAHCVSIEVTKGLKRFVGKTMLFLKREVAA